MNKIGTTIRKNMKYINDKNLFCCIVYTIKLRHNSVNVFNLK